MAIGSERFLVELAEAGEIVSPLPLARVPLTEPRYWAWPTCAAACSA
ncbi:hypothetical protein [Massilia sp. Dwa41.01b]|nr:hypothetical protein [Massilia sp. Dwa41.01b]